MKQWLGAMAFPALLVLSLAFQLLAAHRVFGGLFVPNVPPVLLMLRGLKQGSSAAVLLAFLIGGVLDLFGAGATFYAIFYPALVFFASCLKRYFYRIPLFFAVAAVFMLFTMLGVLQATLWFLKGGTFWAQLFTLYLPTASLNGCIVPLLWPFSGKQPEVI